MFPATLEGMEAPHTLAEYLGYVLLAVIVLGGTLRASRFITTDTLGGWLLRDPLYYRAQLKEISHRSAVRQVLNRYAQAPDEEKTSGASALLERWAVQIDDDEPMSWQMRLVSGLYCPFCVGFWAALAIVLGTVLILTFGPVWLVWAWYVLLTAATLNYIAGHISAKID